MDGFAGWRWGAVFGLSGKKRGQDAVEYAIVFGVTLLVLLIVFVLILFWPSFTQSAEQQRSDYAWANARPFAVKYNSVVPNRVMLQLQNVEPVSLTIKGILVGGRQMDFINYTMPFTWTGSSRCAAGDCTLLMRPGETQIISTVDFASPLDNPCAEGTAFMDGKKYRIALAITYHGADPSKLYNETLSVPLVGACNRAA